MNPATPTLTAVTRAALQATGARAGWVVESTDQHAVVVAAAGGPAPGALIGRRVDLGRGAAAYVLASGQPLAMIPAPGDPMIGEGVAAGLGWSPRSLLAVPCERDDGVVGVLELVDNPQAAFTVDDIEVVTLLAGVAAVALRERATRPAVAHPAVLARGLEHLAAVNPTRYAAVAATVEGLLA